MQTGDTVSIQAVMLLATMFRLPARSGGLGAHGYYYRGSDN